MAGQWPTIPPAANQPSYPACHPTLPFSPRLVGVLDSGDIKISGITLTDPVYWALHVWRGVRVVIDGVTIRGDRGIPNTDGGCGCDLGCGRLEVGSGCSKTPAQWAPFLDSTHEQTLSQLPPASPHLQASSLTAAATSPSAMLTLTRRVMPSPSRQPASGPPRTSPSPAASECVHVLLL